MVLWDLYIQNRLRRHRDILTKLPIKAKSKLMLWKGMRTAREEVGERCRQDRLHR